MTPINTKEYTSFDLYNICIGYVMKEHNNAMNYRLALVTLKERGETDLLYSIALNISY